MSECKQQGQTTSYDGWKPIPRIPERVRSKAWYTPIYATYKARSEEFKKTFRNVPADERLIVEYSCALQREILLQGRLFATPNYLCFYANIFGWETRVTLKWKDVCSVSRENTALLIPNAISFSTESETLFFATFATREKSYYLLRRLWQNALKDHQLFSREHWSWIHEAYGEELALTTDDEDEYLNPPSVSVSTGSASNTKTAANGCVSSEAANGSVSSEEKEQQFSVSLRLFGAIKSNGRMYSTRDERSSFTYDMESPSKDEEFKYDESEDEEFKYEEYGFKEPKDEEYCSIRDASQVSQEIQRNSSGSSPQIDRISVVADERQEIENKNSSSYSKTSQASQEIQRNSSGSSPQIDRISIVADECQEVENKDSSSCSKTSQASQEIQRNSSGSSPQIDRISIVAEECQEIENKDSSSCSKTSQASQNEDQICNQVQRKESRLPEKTRKKAWYTPVFATYKARREEFKRNFKDVPTDERLVVEYSCALQREILVQGRLYATPNFLCFYANIFGWETHVTVKWKDVCSVTKVKTALIIPNAILVSTASEKLFFATFATRDKSYSLLHRLWQYALMDHQLSSHELWSLIHEAYGEELALTSDDEDSYFKPHSVPFDQVSTGSVSNTRTAANGCVSSEEGCPGSSLERNVMEVTPNTTETTNNGETMSNGNNQMSSAGFPTDMSDNSGDSNSETNDETTVTCTSQHDGRLIVDIVLPIKVDDLFQLLFTNSKFLVEFHTLRRTTDFKASPWAEDPQTKERIRTVSMIAALTQPIGPKSSNVHETQVLQPCSKHGKLYSIVGEVINSGIPYSDSFYVIKHYCLQRVDGNKTQMKVFAQLKYKKNVWKILKGTIEKSTWAGLDDFYEALIKALQAECEELMPPNGKVRRRKKSSKVKPPAVTANKIPASARGAVPAEGEKRSDFLLFVVLAVLVLLVFLNGLLYYKLWLMESSTQTGMQKSVLFTDLDVIKSKPESNKELMKALLDQDSLHRMKVNSWRQALQVTTEFLQKAEETLKELKAFLKSSAREPNLADIGKDEL
ncbi:UNVERIFIED_CONTAM: hypothetical protein PYX00_003284 [Menopon gallinae]|uniref:VASt domain-containing protein n=1 Tax=Menopon gallinae TaxID=328185 RepID=A0AAW2I076_9NEOP